MTPAGQYQQNTAFIVACGQNLSVGLGKPARAGSVEMARRISSRDEAETAAEALKIRGALFQRPWEVKLIGADGEVL